MFSSLSFEGHGVWESFIADAWLVGDKNIGTFSLKPNFSNLQLLQYNRGNSLIDLNFFEFFQIIKAFKLKSSENVLITSIFSAERADILPIFLSPPRLATASTLFI